MNDFRQFGLELENPRYCGRNAPRLRSGLQISSNLVVDSVTYPPITRNATLLEAGLDAKVGRNATVGPSHAGQFGSGNQDHSATLANGGGRPKWGRHGTGVMQLRTVIPVALCWCFSYCPEYLKNTGVGYWYSLVFASL